MAPVTDAPAPALAELRAEAAREDEALRVEPPAAPGHEPETAPPAQLTPEQLLAEQVESWRFLIDLAADHLSDIRPALKAVYTEDRRAGLAERAAVVAVKHKITAFAWLDKYKEEIAVVLFAVPILRETTRALKAPPASSSAPAAASPVEAVQPAAAPAGDALRPNAGSA